MDDFGAALIIGIVCLLVGGFFGAIIATPSENYTPGAEDRDKFWAIIVEACEKQNKVPGLLTETDENGWQRVNVGCKDRP